MAAEAASLLHTSQRKLTRAGSTGLPFPRSPASIWWGISRRSRTANPRLPPFLRGPRCPLARLRASPGHDHECKKPQPPPKPRSLTSAHASSSSPRIRSHSRPQPGRRASPARTPSALPRRPYPTRVVHALLGGIGSLRLTESPFEDPVRLRVR
ncbi:hypothetical protein B0H11DRAFT_2017592 [Mycena galericulata]|nr:hypothetical protein B0H11DRAFT_2017592 [Mycena galericulata]